MRWLLSTVPSVMIFDDHDVHDDWNTSTTWLREIRAQPWWQARIEGALMSYWCYQHLGNLSPEDLARDELYAAVRAAGTTAARWCATSPAAPTPRPTAPSGATAATSAGCGCVVIDSRASRVLEPGRRSMLDEAEWRWVEETAAAIATTCCWARRCRGCMEPGMHQLEAWNEAVAEGAWGRRAGRLAEGCARRWTSSTGRRSTARFAAWRRTSAPSPAASAGPRPRRSSRCRVTCITPT